jgi:hypothetical protein
VQHIAHMGSTKNAYRTFVGEPHWKKLHGRMRYRWKDVIKMRLREVECEFMNRI